MSERGRPGFTLIEIVIVMIIVALSAVVAIPAWRATMVPDDLARAEGAFGDLFRLARDSAIASGRTLTVVVDSATAAVWLETDVRPGGDAFLSMEVPSAMGNRAAGQIRGALPGAGRSRFDPTPDGATALDIPESVRVLAPRARSRFTFTPGGLAFSDSLVLAGIGGIRVLTLDLGTGDVQSR